MTSYPNQFLYMADADGCPREIVNGARAAYNMEVAGLCGSGRFTNVLEDMGCAALSWAPVCATNALDYTQSTVTPNMDGWQADTNCSISRSTLAQRDGEGSLRISSTAAGWAQAIATPGGCGFPVVGGASYTIHSSYRAAGASSTAYTWVEWYTSGCVYISSTTSAGILSVSTAWTEEVYTEAAPSTAAYGIVSTGFTAAGANERHYVDRVGVMLNLDPTRPEPWAVGDWFADEPSVAWAQWITHSPDDPWDNGGVGADDALGMLIEEWTGIDGAHHTRAQAATGINRGGVRFGPHSHKGRVMKFNVLLLARSEQGVTHLFRWLENQLIDQASACAERSMWVRDYCPTVDAGSDATDDQLRAGWYRLDRVALVEGPTWESPPVKDAEGCYLRRVSFTIIAGDPCLYGYGSNVFEQQMNVGGLSWSGGYTVASCSKWTTSNVQAQATVSPGTVGMLAPRITIHSYYEVDGSDPKNLPDLRIFGIATPAAGSVTPCTGDKLGELVISPYQMAGSEIVIDLAARTVKYRDPDHSVDWSDGSVLLRSTGDGLKRWWDFGSSGGTIYVEPYYNGLTNYIAGDAVAVLYGWFVRIDMVLRVGCA